MTRAEGRWTTLEAHGLYEHAFAAGAVYRAVLRAEVRERLPWVSWREVGRGLFEIEGVPDAVLGEFSRRRVENEERAFPRTMSGMASRTERIEARIDPDSAERIRYASALEHTSLSGFMVAAAAEKAERVIADHAYTLVPSDYFDRLLEVLDEPAEPVPEIAAVARREREQPRFRRA
jgi:uncharacterized protein (DUF1778 family)